MYEPGSHLVSSGAVATLSGEISLLGTCFMFFFSPLSCTCFIWYLLGEGYHFSAAEACRYQHLQEVATEPIVLHMAVFAQIATTFRCYKAVKNALCKQSCLFQVPKLEGVPKISVL